MTEQKEHIFTKGLFVNEPRQDFIKYSISIKAEEFKEFLDKQEKNEKGYVNIDFFNSKNTGKDYGEVNTWKPKTEEVKEEIKVSDIPF